ncbi:hypothetical protein QR680_009862 [Steinernema hermaphroditum]|uniref:Uncharacterized protein n=1 Tax=Steinernema hermaphroditum TaxID=289476 RepID=A0AA39IPD9_9BILA|nr:hypothetical protein QR680_009862 [Steinernema hermaphroditum]
MNSSNDVAIHSTTDSLPLGVSYSLVVAVYLPLYVIIIWILNTSKQYDGVILYRLLEHLFIANLLSIISTFTSALYELTRKTFHPLIDITSGSLSAWFDVGFTLLGFLLASNQLSVAFNFEILYERDIHKYCIFLIWYALVVLILMTVYLRVDFHYDFQTHYFHDPTEKYETPLIVLRHITTTFYIVIVFRLIYVKFKKHQSVDRNNLHNLYQALALHLPTDIRLIVFQIFRKQIFAASLSKVIYFVLYRSLPAISITILLFLNRTLWKHVCKLVALTKKRFFNAIREVRHWS